jgi:hypothetical protein
MKRKFSIENKYEGNVGVQCIFVTAKTKREAEKKLRLQFLLAGIKTQPDPMTDLLTITR